jgi:hypothetical protein
MYDKTNKYDMENIMRDKDMTLYSQVNTMAAYVGMIKFAVEKLETYIDDIGDDVLFDGMSPFPADVLGDDSLFAGYTDPWSPDDDFDEFGAFYTPAEAGCDCEVCRCDDEYDDKRVNRPESKEEYFNWIDSKRMSVGNIMDILNKTRKAPQDYRMD